MEVYRDMLEKTHLLMVKEGHAIKSTYSGCEAPHQE